MLPGHRHLLTRWTAVLSTSQASAEPRMRQWFLGAFQPQPQTHQPCWLDAGRPPARLAIYLSIHLSVAPSSSYLSTSNQHLMSPDVMFVLLKSVNSSANQKPHQNRLCGLRVAGAGAAGP